MGDGQANARHSCLAIRSSAAQGRLAKSEAFDQVLELSRHEAAPAIFGQARPPAKPDAPPAPMPSPARAISPPGPVGPATASAPVDAAAPAGKGRGTHAAAGNGGLPQHRPRSGQAGRAATDSNGDGTTRSARLTGECTHRPGVASPREIHVVPSQWLSDLGETMPPEGGRTSARCLRRICAALPTRGGPSGPSRFEPSERTCCSPSELAANLRQTRRDPHQKA